MRIYRHIPWPILLSTGVHLSLAMALVMQTTVRTPRAIHVVHMHLMAVEHHAAPAVKAQHDVRPETVDTRPTPNPKPVLPHPHVKPLPKVQAQKPKLAVALTPPKPLPLPLPTSAAAGMAVATKPEAIALKPVQPVIAAAEPPAAVATPSNASADAGEGDDQLDGGDQSAEAMLIHSTVVKPEYTSEALFARLEGLFPMNINIDEAGRVISAQLAKKVGYGMDQRILAAMKEARFQAGRDARGKAHGGWVKIKFKLEIPE